MAAKGCSRPCVFIVGLMSPPLRSWLSYDLFWSMEYIGNCLLPVPGWDLRGLDAYYFCFFVLDNSCHEKKLNYLVGERPVKGMRNYTQREREARQPGCCSHLTWDIRGMNESCGPSMPNLAMSTKPQTGEAQSEKLCPISKLWANKQWF